MDFDFYALYQDKSDNELLEILRSAHKYQPEAIAAVKQLLNERNVAVDDIAIVQDSPIESNKSAARNGKIKGWIYELLEPAFHPERQTKPEKLLNLLLAIIFVGFGGFLLHALTSLNDYTGNLSSKRAYNKYLLYFDLLYIPVTTILLIKRRWWGWILYYTVTIWNIVTFLSFRIFFDFFNYFCLFIPPSFKES